VVPALGATGRRLSARLQRAVSGGSGPQDPAAVSSDDDPDAWQRRYDEYITELTHLLEARPEIQAVTFMGMPPWLDPDLPFEMEGATADPLTGTSRARKPV
jgi:hypothetical protein